jgi:hypothetical protein
MLGDAATARRDWPEAGTRYQEALAIAEQLGMAPVRAQCSDGLARLASVGEMAMVSRN